MYTLKVNIRAQQERERKEKERAAKEAISKIQAISGPTPAARKRKGLNFHEPGTFVAQGEKLRKKAKLEALQKKIADRAAKTGITEAVKLATLTTKQETVNINTTAQTTDAQSIKSTEDVPEVEWWDKDFLGIKSFEFTLNQLKEEVNPEQIFDNITNLVEHPPIKSSSLAQKDIDVEEVVYLTKKERKKLRKHNRKVAESEKQEKIKLGLLPKPEPKLKKSNIMHALGDEAIINPSKADALVKEQEEKRQAAHLEHNESKKLTAEEKRWKKMQKVQEDLAVVGTWVAVYRIQKLLSPANKFKVMQNARQLTMTGILVLFSDFNLVVVEGGPKQQRKFKHLMLDRIDWTENQLVADAKVEPAATGENCQLVWEGQVDCRSFRGFKTKSVTNMTQAKDIFVQAKVEHYWDIAFKLSVLESIED